VKNKYITKAQPIQRAVQMHLDELVKLSKGTSDPSNCVDSILESVIHQKGADILVPEEVFNKYFGKNNDNLDLRNKSKDCKDCSRQQRRSMQDRK